MPTSTELIIPIANANDDAEEFISYEPSCADQTSHFLGEMYLDSSDLELGQEYQTCYRMQYVGLRFLVNIDPGTTIIRATIEFTVDIYDTVTNPVVGVNDPNTVVISGENNADAPPFTATSFSISNRNYLGMTETWSPEVWGASPTSHDSTDISSIIQIIVNKAGWANGNAMVFMIEGNSTGIRLANSYDKSSTLAPKLKIVTGAPNTVPPTGLPSGVPTSAPLPFQPTLSPTMEYTPYCGFALNSFSKATDCAVIQIGAAKVDMTGGNPTGAFGSVCLVGTGATIGSMSGGQRIRGNYLAEPDAVTPTNIGTFVDGEVVVDADLSTATVQINNLRTTIGAAACTDTLTNGNDLYGVFDTTNKHVICFSVTDIDLKSHITLTGSGAHTVYIKMKKLIFGSTFSIAPPLRVDQVIWYLGEDGDTVTGTGEISGIILAPAAKVDIKGTTAKVTGTIIAGKDIKLTGSASVGCPP